MENRSNPDEAHAEAARLAVLTAVEILKRTREGDKLLALHKYYPTGWAAFGTGFMMMWGAASLVCIMIFLSSVLSWIRA